MRQWGPLDETQRYFTKDHPIIVPLTVKDGERPEIPSGNRLTVPDIWTSPNGWRTCAMGEETTLRHCKHQGKADKATWFGPDGDVTPKGFIHWCAVKECKPGDMPGRRRSIRVDDAGRCSEAASCQDYAEAD